jgi:dihydrofolate reductase
MKSRATHQSWTNPAGSPTRLENAWLDEGLVDELTIIVAPVVLGGGKRLFEGFTKSLELEHIGARQSTYATFIDYRVT